MSSLLSIVRDSTARYLLVISFTGCCCVYGVNNIFLLNPKVVVLLLKVADVSAVISPYHFLLVAMSDRSSALGDTDGLLYGISPKLVSSSSSSSVIMGEGRASLPTSQLYTWIVRWKVIT